MKPIAGQKSLNDYFAPVSKGKKLVLPPSLSPSPVQERAVPSLPLPPKRQQHATSFPPTSSKRKRHAEPSLPPSPVQEPAVSSLSLAPKRQRHAASFLPPSPPHERAIQSSLPPPPETRQRAQSFISISSDGDEPDSQVPTRLISQVYTGPVNQVCAKPFNQVNAEPINQAYEEPTSQVYEEPINQVYEESNNQVYEESNNQVYAEPITPASTQPQLCREQQDLFDLIMMGHNVFFTGSAGCGKSTVLKAAIAALEAQGEKVAVTAPTGRAALNIDGITLHSFMGWNTDDVALELRKLRGKMLSKAKKSIRTSIRQTSVLVIDEISMVENNFLSRMEEILRDIRGDAPWGGLQLIVTGDFCQLPPVLPFRNCWECGRVGKKWSDEDGERMTCPMGHGTWDIDNDQWAFQSPAWQYANFVNVHLTEIHRQSDRPFIEVLQKCRLGIPLSRQNLDLLLNHESEVEDATELVCTRKEADERNEEKLNGITQFEPKDYTCEDGIWFPPDYPGSREFLSKRTRQGTLQYFEGDRQRLNAKIQLKTSQLVLLQVNLNLKRGLANGSQGVIIGWEGIDINKLPSLDGPDSELREQHVLLFTEEYLRNCRPRDRCWPVVRFSNGCIKTIYPVCLVNSVNNYSRIKVFRTQIPLMPGWAITIHRSQGMTLDRVIVDLTNAFEVGQAYVALSRATTLSGLHIEGDRHRLSRKLTSRNLVVHEFLRQTFGDQIYDHIGSAVDVPHQNNA